MRIGIWLLGLLLLSGCSGKREMPDDFNFRLADKIHAIDTYTGTFTRRFSKGDSTIPLALTAAEKKEIYRMMDSLNVFNYPRLYQAPAPESVIPCPSSELKVSGFGKTSVLAWSHCPGQASTEQRNFMVIVRTIISMVGQKETIQKMQRSDLPVL